MKKLLITLLLLLSTALSFGEELIKGKVLEVVSGDSFKMEGQNKSAITVTINGIISPKGSQTFAKESAEFLKKALLNQTVTLDVLKETNANTKIGDVTFNKEDLAYFIVKNGFAWQYKEYSNDNRLKTYEEEARKNKLGLWAGVNPIYPPEWVKQPPISIVITQDMWNDVMNRLKSLEDKVTGGTLQNSIVKEDAYYINAFALNIRTTPDLNNEPIGTFFKDIKVKVVDKSNSEWYKVKIDDSQWLDPVVSKTLTVFSDLMNKNIVSISNKFIKDGKVLLNPNREYYLNSKYLTAKINNSIPEGFTIPLNSITPFVYGLTFYDDSIASTLEKSIWYYLGDKLKKLGYDGIDVVRYTAATGINDIKAGKYDVVESSSGDLAFANQDPKKPLAFLKDTPVTVFSKTFGKYVQSGYYQGVMIINKNSNIKYNKNNFDYSQLKGKNILTGTERSESSYKYPKYYLETYQNLSIEKDFTNIGKLYHSDILLKVASGQAEVGFVGDFVLTDPWYKFEGNAKALGIKMENQDDIDKLRNNIYVVEFKGINKIPQMPHAIKTSILQKDKTFVDSLEKIVADIYNENREDFGMIDSSNDEYEPLLKFE